MNYSNHSIRLKTAPTPPQAPEATAMRREARPRPAAGPKKRRMDHGIALGVSVLAFFASVATGATVVEFDVPDFDKMIYPFSSGGGGTRQSALTFGAVGSSGFDNRDSQFFVRFKTSTEIQAGLTPTSYQIVSAKLTLKIQSGGAIVFDGTYDPINTYDGEGKPINGDDPGRPLELYGAGYRNGFTSATVAEGTAFGSTNPTAQRTRNIYATDFLGGTGLNGPSRDVSNNVLDGFNPSPFSIGQVAPSEIDENGRIEEDANVVFTLDLANSDIIHYLQYSLAEGNLSFLATSLHVAAQGGDLTYAEYYTMDNLLGVVPPRLDLVVEIVPEPGTATLSFCAFGFFGAFWRGRQAIQKKEVMS